MALEKSCTFDLNRGSFLSVEVFQKRSNAGGALDLPLQPQKHQSRTCCSCLPPAIVEFLKLSSVGRKLLEQTKNEKCQCHCSFNENKSPVSLATTTSKPAGHKDLGSNLTARPSIIADVRGAELPRRDNTRLEDFTVETKPTENGETTEINRLQLTTPKESATGQHSEHPNDEDTQQPELMRPSQGIGPLYTITETEKGETTDRSPLQSTIPEQLINSPEIIDTVLPDVQRDIPQQPELAPSQSVIPLDTITQTENGKTTDRSPLHSTIPEELNNSPDIVDIALPDVQRDIPQQPELAPSKSIIPLDTITQTENGATTDIGPVQSTRPEQLINTPEIIDTVLPDVQRDIPQQPELSPKQSIKPLDTITQTENGETTDISPVQSTRPEQLINSPDIVCTVLPDVQRDIPQQPELSPSQSIIPLDTITKTENGETTAISPVQSTRPEQLINTPELIDTVLPDVQRHIPQQPELSPSQSIKPLDTITQTENGETTDIGPVQSTRPEQLINSPDIVDTVLPDVQRDIPQQPELIPSQSIIPLDTITKQKMEKLLLLVPYSQPDPNS
nr:unnamed protein product [Callosobruchus analis]